MRESPDTAEHDPDYRELGRFPTEEEAYKVLARRIERHDFVLASANGVDGPDTPAMTSGEAMPRRDAIEVEGGPARA